MFAILAQAAVFYITHSSADEESAYLRTALGLDVRGPEMPVVAAGTRIRVPGCPVSSPAGGAALWVDPDTASWCVFEGPEAALAEFLADERAWTELLPAACGAPAEALLRLLGHCWAAGLLEVDGRGRWPRGMFAAGPLYRPSYLVEIHLTSRCNLACRYCSAGSGATGVDMPDDLAFQAVDRALEIAADDLTIEFAGGEPLLRLGLLTRLVERIEATTQRPGRSVQVVVQTNGLLLRGEALSFFAEHPAVDVGVSLDGPAPINDLARSSAAGKGRHRRIEDAARALVARLGKEAGAIAVIHSGSWDRVPEIAAYFARLGLGKVRMNPAAPLGRGSEEGAGLVVSPRQYLHAMQALLDYLADDPAFEESNLEAMARNLVLKTRQYRCMRSPCGAGIDYLVVDATGAVYPCARFLGRPDLCLGRLQDGGLEGRAARSAVVCDVARRTVSRVPRCAACRWRHFCEGGCALSARDSGGALEAPDPLCEFYRGMYPHLMEYLYLNPAMAQHFVPGVTVRRVSPQPAPASDAVVTRT